MIIYGASGHGKVIEDVVEAMGQSVSCFIDDNEALCHVHGKPVVPGLNASFDEPLIIAIGDNTIRKRIASSICADYGTVVHPSAIISPRAMVGEGSVVMAGAVVQTDAVIGRHCIVNTGAVVDHECRIADFVHLSPHATLCGNVTVGEGAWVGAGATVIQGVSIGRWAVVGAGSVITEDVPDYALVFGGRLLTVKENYYKLKITEMSENLSGGGESELMVIVECLALFILMRMNKLKEAI